MQLSDRTTGPKLAPPTVGQPIAAATSELVLERGRFPAAPDGLWLFPRVRAASDLGRHSCGAPENGAREDATRRRAVGRHHRQPERQERRKRGERIDSVGFDAAKKIKGVKRHIATDTQGLLLSAIVHPANVQDRDSAVDLLKELKKLFPGLKQIWADSGYNAHKLTEAFKAMGDWKLEIVKRSGTARGFEVLPRRWVVERTLAWMGRKRANDSRTFTTDLGSQPAKPQSWSSPTRGMVPSERLALITDLGKP